MAGEPAAAGAAGDAGGAATPGLWLLSGARAVEAALVARLRELAVEARRDPRVLALPVRVVVPSRSLRRHVAARLVRGAGAVAGVVVQTLHGLACEVLERIGQAAPRGELLSATVVERLARAEPLLRRGLGGLEDGFLAVAAAVDDLLTAGFEPEHAAAADEALAADGPRAAGRSQVEVARAVLRVAAAADRELERLGLGRRAALLRQAVAALAAAPDEALPARAILLHGFVAAGGAAADLLEALLRRPGCQLLLDRPPVPGAARPQEAVEDAAVLRLAERAAGAARGPVAEAAAGQGHGAGAAPRAFRMAWTVPPRLEAFTAAGSDAEAREVARRLRRLLDGGTAPPPGEGWAAPRPSQEGPAAPLPPGQVRPASPAPGREISALQPPGQKRTAPLPGRRRTAQAAPGQQSFAWPAPGEARSASPPLGQERAIPPASGQQAPAWSSPGPERFGGAPLEPARSASPLPAAERSPVPRPEDLAVVARDFGPYQAALRRHLHRLGVPFSGVGERGGLLPAGRRAAAVLDLLRLGEEAPADRWLDACQALPAELRADLGLAWRALGAARLREVAALRGLAFAEGYALPVREGLVAADATAGDDGRAVAPARRIAGARLRQGIEAAAATLRLLAEWPRQAPLTAHLAQAGALLADLGLADDPEQPLAAAVAELGRELPSDLLLGAEELRLLLARAVGGAGRCPLGGAGGGVQLLSFAEARGRTFEHLFLIGLNRGVFPRQVREDPLLPDELRLVLRTVLPDLALARDAAADERHAFAQLLSAAPAVCLSWRSADDDGRPLAASPAAARVLGGGEAAVAPALYSEPRAPAELRPADEHAVVAGLRGSRRDLAAVLPLAAREVRRQWGRALLALDPAAVAAARLAVLAELDPDPRTAEGRAAAARLGPYFGFVGAAPARPAGQPLHVAHLEGLAACPWQLFLGRVLRLERPPEPLRVLPGSDPQRLGSLVHRVLDRLVRRALAAVGTPARPVPVRWPADGEVEALLVEAAAAVLAEDGLELPGMARALASHARPFVAAARAADWPAAESEVAVVAGEVRGEVRLDGHPGTLRFRADREDLVAGRRRFTDYKTGRPLSAARTAAKVREALLEEVAAGRRLQAAAYVEAAGPVPASGRYLFLSPDLEAEAGRVVEVAAEDAEVRAAFAAAAGAALAAWDGGSFFPRLAKADGRDEPERCAWCEVAEACLRGDAGARRRLADWTAAAAGGPQPVHGAEAALLAVWRLGGAPVVGESTAPAVPRAPRAPRAPMMPMAPMAPIAPTAPMSPARPTTPTTPMTPPRPRSAMPEAAETTPEDEA